MDKGQACDDGSACDAAHGNQGDQCNLCPPLQLQMPDQESRDDGKSKVGNDGEDAVDIAEGGNDGVVDALSLLRSAIPHVRDGVALEEADKEKGTSGDN